MLNVIGSHLERVMVCAGSLQFKDLPQEEQTDAAKEGVAAGEFLEHLLKNEEIHTHARNGVQFDEEMKFYATEVHEEIRGKAESIIFAEQKVDWTTRSGITIKSRYDIAFEIGDKLYIDDYKYGWNPVEVKKNWQLINYAVGEVIRRNQSWKSIVLRIHQPRPHHEDGPTREWEISYEELLKYKEIIETRMDEIVRGEQSLHTTNSCKYCPAAVHCPAFNKAYHRGVEVLHEFLQDNLDEHELSFQLDLLARIEDLVKTRKGSLEQLAVSRIKENKLIDGYVVESSYGNRKWKSDFNPETIKMLTGKDIISTTTLSPAKAERMGIPRELMDSMTDRRFLGQKLKKKNTSAIGDSIFGKPG